MCSAGTTPVRRGVYVSGRNVGGVGLGMLDVLCVGGRRPVDGCSGSAVGEPAWVTRVRGAWVLANEALLTAWPRLRGWIHEDREHLCVDRVLTRSGTHLGGAGP